MEEKEFYNTNTNEQESVVNIIYEQRAVSVYTSRKQMYFRLIAKIGKPTKIYFVDKKITGGRWDISFNDRDKIKKVLCLSTLIGQMKK